MKMHWLMKNSTVQNILKTCEYCAKEIGRAAISPNMLLHVLSIDPQIQSHLQMHHTNMKMLRYLLNPYHMKGKTVRAVALSSDVKDMLSKISPLDGYKDIFLKLVQFPYVQEMLLRCGYVPSDGEYSILAKYTQRIEGGVDVVQYHEKYEKIHKLLGHQNVMVMGESGSGRYTFVKGFASHYANMFSVFSFDVFHYLKVDEERLFGIVNGVFEELGDNYLYIPNFVQTLEWLRSLKLTSLCILLKDFAYMGRIITKGNKRFFDSKQFQLSKEYNCYALNTPDVGVKQLYSILEDEASMYEHFYHITIAQRDIRNIVKESNLSHLSLAQPGRALKRLMYQALDSYGNTGNFLTKPKEQKLIFAPAHLKQILNEKIIGQEKAIDELIYDLELVDFTRFGIVSSFLFCGEIGCGKLKTAQELASTLFGVGGFRYIDLHTYVQYPYKLQIYKALDVLIESLYGGILFLDNIEYLPVEEIDIFSYIEMKIKQLWEDEIMVPIIVIASTRMEVTKMDAYKYIIEHFNRVINFEKLTVRDLEKIAEIQIKKYQSVKRNMLDFNAFLIGAQADPSLNALGVKKRISSIAA